MTRTKWASLVPYGLLALCAVPVAAGLARLREVGIGTITAENARFLTARTPVVLHILSASVFGLLGAFQFAEEFRRRRPQWHRIAGRILVPCGLVVSFSGLWMTQFYPSVGFDGPALYWIRLLVGSSMALSVILGVAAIGKRDFQAHQAWMLRAYALAMGAGTQVLTHIPWILFPAIQGEFSRTVFMAAGWGINLWIAEAITARSGRQASAPAALPALKPRKASPVQL